MAKAENDNTTPSPPSLKLVTPGAAAPAGSRVPSADHPFSRLTFFKTAKGRGSPPDFWNVIPSGDYGQDCVLGAALGRETLDCLRRTDSEGCAMLLRSIVKSVAARGSFGGVEVGFFGVIGRAVWRGIVS